MVGEGLEKEEIMAPSQFMAISSTYFNDLFLSNQRRYKAEAKKAEADKKPEEEKPEEAKVAKSYEVQKETK